MARWPCEETTFDFEIGEWNPIIVRLWINNTDDDHENQHDWFEAVRAEIGRNAFGDARQIARAIAAMGASRGLNAVQVRLKGAQRGHMIYTVPF